MILPEAPPEPEIPLFVRQTVWVDLRDWKRKDSDAFYRLVCGILGRPRTFVEAPLRAVGKQGVDSQRVVLHFSIADRSRSAGIVRRHPPNCGPRGG